MTCPAGLLTSLMPRVLASGSSSSSLRTWALPGPLLQPTCCLSISSHCFRNPNPPLCRHPDLAGNVLAGFNAVNGEDAGNFNDLVRGGAVMKQSNDCCGIRHAYLGGQHSLLAALMWVPWTCCF